MSWIGIHSIFARANLVCPSKHLPARSAGILEAGSGERHMVGATAASALLNVHLGYDLIRTCARLQTGGNIRAFLALMLTFGKDVAPPTVLMKLRTQRDVTCWGREQSGDACDGFQHVYSCC